MSAPDLATKLRETNTPLFALESRHPLTDFDILGFNLSYELGVTNILEMLSLAGIPLTWRERDYRDRRRSRDGPEQGAGEYPFNFCRRTNGHL